MVEGPVHAIRLSTIIDLPGDPVLVRRGPVVAPKDALISVPAKLGQEAPKTPAKALFVYSTLVSTTGGYMGKFQEAGQEAEALAAQLAVNSAQVAAAQNAPDYGSDDDGGADTPADAQSQFLTTANSNELEINLGGSRGQPQLKETILKPLVADTISNLLIANGYDAESARVIESAAKDLPPISKLCRPKASLWPWALWTSPAPTGSSSSRSSRTANMSSRSQPRTMAGMSKQPSPSSRRYCSTTSSGTRQSGHASRSRTASIARVSATECRSPSSAKRSSLSAASPTCACRSRPSRPCAFCSSRNLGTRARQAARSFTLACTETPSPSTAIRSRGSDGAFRCFDPKAASEGAGESTPMQPSLGNSGATSVGGILAPIKGAPITSLFGLRFHPILHILRLHAGIDFGAPVGSLVRAAADGKVEIAGPVSGFGNHVRIQHTGFETSYSHLSEIPETIHPGVEVKQGDIIALSGNTGLSTGPHLHFEFYLNRDAVDPLPHLGSEISDGRGVAEGSGYRHRRGGRAASARGDGRRSRRLSGDQGLSRPGDRQPG